MMLALTLAAAAMTDAVPAAPVAFPPVVRVGSKSAALVAKQSVEMKRRLRDDGRDDAQAALASRTAQTLFAKPDKVKIVGSECARTLCQVQLTASAAATRTLVDAIDDAPLMRRAAAAGYRIVALASPATAENKGPQQVTLWFDRSTGPVQFQPVS